MNLPHLFPTSFHPSSFLLLRELEVGVVAPIVPMAMVVMAICSTPAREQENVVSVAVRVTKTTEVVVASGTASGGSWVLAPVDELAWEVCDV